MKKICAGIVTFNPDIKRLNLNICNIINQVEKIFIVDNSSMNFDKWAPIMSNNPHIFLIHNKENRGIAKALNQMCKEALINGYEWILTLDQDTVCSKNMINKMYPYTRIKDIGIVCPAVQYEGWKSKKSDEYRANYVKACMTSASLTRLNAWKQVGMFRDDYFIDYVDNEFCMKLRINQYKILRVNSCYINHQLGNTGNVNIFGLFNLEYSRHSPLRQYYMIRNNYAFICEYRKYLNVIKETIKLCYIFLGGLVFSENKRQTLYYEMLGLLHARKKKMGILKT